MKHAFLALESRNACFIYLRGKKKQRWYPLFFLREAFSVEVGNSGRKKGKRLSNQNGAKLFWETKRVCSFCLFQRTMTVSPVLPECREHTRSRPGTPWPWCGLSREEGARETRQAGVTLTTARRRPESLSHRGGKSCHKRERAIRRRAKGA